MVTPRQFFDEAMRRQTMSPLEQFEEYLREQGLQPTRGGGAAAAPPPEPLVTREKRPRPQAATPQRDIGERERRVFALMQTGLTEKQARRQEAEEFRTQTLEPAFEERQEERRREEIAEQFEEEGRFEERLPEIVELDISEKERAIAEGVPVVGAPGQAIASGILNLMRATPFKTFLGDVGELPDLIQDPETRREIMLREIQREELDRTINVNEALGITLEALGANNLPADIGKFVEAFTKTPSEDVNNLREQIKEIQSRASGMVDASAQGELGDPLITLQSLDRMEREVYRAESKIKYAITLSSTLQSDPEQVNIIEEEILSAKTDIFEAKQRAMEGAAITPTESRLYLRLQELKNVA